MSGVGGDLRRTLRAAYDIIFAEREAQFPSSSHWNSKVLPIDDFTCNRAGDHNRIVGGGVALDHG